MDKSFYTGTRESSFLDLPKNMRRFNTLEEAIEHYRTMTSKRFKVLGMTDGKCAIPILRCEKLFKDDVYGENILDCRHRAQLFWKDLPGFEDAEKACLKEFKIRYRMTNDKIEPVPKAKELSDEFDGQYLWASYSEDCSVAIRKIYIAGLGWLTPAEAKRCKLEFPLVLKYRADGLSEDGAYLFLEIEPWEFDLLAERTKARIEENKRRKENEQK